MLGPGRVETTTANVICSVQVLLHHVLHFRFFSFSAAQHVSLQVQLLRLCCFELQAFSILTWFAPMNVEVHII